MVFAVLRKAGWKVDENLPGRNALAPQVAETQGVTVSRFGELKLRSGAKVQTFSPRQPMPSLKAYRS